MNLILKHDNKQNGYDFNVYAKDFQNSEICEDYELFEKIVMYVLESAFEFGYRNISVDFKNCLEWGSYSYIFNSLNDDISAAENKYSFIADENFTITCLLDGPAAGSNDLLSNLEDSLLCVHKITVNQSFGDFDDPITEKFLKYNDQFKNTNPFRETLLEFIESRDIEDYPQAYKSSGVSKSTFSKIINYKNAYKPSKETVAAFTIGLKLNIEEAQRLYHSAGFHLGEQDFLDRVIRFFIRECRYGIDEVNYCLEEFGYPPLGEHPREGKVNVKIK